MQLYFAPYACSMVVRIVAEAARIPLEYREVDLYTKRFTADGADYLAQVPRGLVPVLVFEDGEALMEVSAIAISLGEQCPEAGLLGSSARERRRALEGLSFAATEIHKRLLFVLGTDSTPKEVRAHARATASRILAELAQAVEPGPYYAGERFTVADAYLAWALVMARTFRLELSSVDAYAARLAAHPAVAAALAIETPLALASWKRQREFVGEPPWLR